MKLNNPLNINIIKLFECKCNQNIINYAKTSIFKIFASYYARVAYSVILHIRKKIEHDKIKSLVISHVDSIKEYGYLKKYDKYIKYSDIYNNISMLFVEILKFPRYIYQYSKLHSKYKNQIFESFLRSQIIVNFVEYNKVPLIIFFGYEYDLTFFFAIIRLNEKKIHTVVYSNTGYYDLHNLQVANKIYCRTNLHKRFAINNPDIFRCKEVSYLFKLQDMHNNKHEKKRIAIYTSGFYARFIHDFSNKEYLSQAKIAEEKLINTMKNYAMQNRDIEFVLFIHLHNCIENLEDAKKYYEGFLSLKNVRLAKKTENSIENFDKYTLGICCMSEIFFDRAERGYKTILMNPFKCKDFIEDTNLKRISVYSDSYDIFEKIKFFYDLSYADYFKLLNK